MNWKVWKYNLDYKNLLKRSGIDHAIDMQEVLKEKVVHVTGIWTHFAYADEIGSPDYEAEKNPCTDDEPYVNYC